MKTKILCERIKVNLDEILRGRQNIRLKADHSYVSDGDLFVQALVYQWIIEFYPNHLLISEELETNRSEWDSHGNYVVLDPIDGTENFISGLKEWGVGVSVYTLGQHTESCIYLPELDEIQITGMSLKKYKSRIVGLSSSLNQNDLLSLNWEKGFEYRIIGCAMYNLLMVVRGSYHAFENVKGVNCWDVLPGLNLAIEAGVPSWVNGVPYNGEILFPTQKYKVKLKNEGVYND